MRGETSAAWLDNGTAIGNGWMFCNHSVILFVLWNDLNGIENRSISGELRNQEMIREQLESISGKFTLEYLLAVINSPKAEEILESTTVSARRSRFQPNDFRKLPMANATAKQQKEITVKVEKLLQLGEEFLNLRREGWEIKTSDGTTNAPAILSKYPSIRKNPLALAKVAWGMTINDPTAYAAELRRKENIFLRGKNQTAVEFSGDVEEEALIWIERQFGQMPKNQSFQSAEAEAVKFPASPAEAVKALELLLKDETEIADKTDDFNKLKTEINELIDNLYESRKE